MNLFKAIGHGVVAGVKAVGGIRVKRSSTPMSIYPKNPDPGKQVDPSSPPVPIHHPPSAPQAPGYFTEGTEAIQESKPLTGATTFPLASRILSGSKPLADNGSVDSPAKPLSPQQVVASQAEELVEHAKTGQPMTYEPSPAAVALAKATAPHLFPTETADVAASIAPEPVAASRVIDYATESMVGASPSVVIQPAAPAAVPTEVKEIPVATAPVAHQNPLQKIGSILDAAAHWLASKLNPVIKVGLAAAQLAEPFVDAFLPGWAGLYDSTVQLITREEAAAVAASQTGTGGQKMANVLAALTPIALSYLKSVGISNPTADQIQAYVQNVYNGLQIFNKEFAAFESGTSTPTS